MTAEVAQIREAMDTSGRLLPGWCCVTTITLAFLSDQHDVRYVPFSYAKR